MLRNATVLLFLTSAAMAAAFLAASGVSATPDTSAVYAKCNPDAIPQGSPFWGNLGTTLHQLVENTAYAGYHLKTQNGGGNCPAYGEATCNQGISAEDCCACLNYLSSRIWTLCNDAVGADVKVGDCCIRYESYRF